MSAKAGIVPGKPTRTIVPRTAESSARRARPRSTAGRRLEQRVQLRVTAFGDSIAIAYSDFVLSFPFVLVVS